MSDLDLSEAIDAASNATEHVQGALVIAVTAAASVIERQVREHIAADLMAQIGEYNPVGDSFFRLAAIIARDGRNLARGDGS